LGIFSSLGSSSIVEMMCVARRRCLGKAMSLSHVVNAPGLVLWMLTSDRSQKKRRLPCPDVRSGIEDVASQAGRGERRFFFPARAYSVPPHRLKSALQKASLPATRKITAQRLLDLLKLRLLEELLLLDRLLDRLILLSLAFSLTIFSFSAARSSCLFQWLPSS
jgi:hypothetical protein